jgi:predicted RNase H-like nuclease (RuvC/YqgF family)
MNKSLQIQYKAETGKHSCDVFIMTCPYCRKINITNGNPSLDYIEWLEAKVEELSARPVSDCQNCDPLQDAESKINDLYGQLEDADSEIRDLQNQLDPTL